MVPASAALGPVWRKSRCPGSTDCRQKLHIPQPHDVEAELMITRFFVDKNTGFGGPTGEDD